MKCKAISAVFLLAAVHAISYAVPAVQVVPVAAVTGDPTGLVGKTVTPANSDSINKAFGNDYYLCGGAMVNGMGPNIGILTIRKGEKTSCQITVGKQTVALTRISNEAKSYEFLDVLEINVPKGYEFTASGCTGAKMAVSKNERDATHLTKHMQAWDVVNFKLVPITNLKAVKCENMGYGL